MLSDPQVLSSGRMFTDMHVSQGRILVIHCFGERCMHVVPLIDPLRLMLIHYRAPCRTCQQCCPLQGSLPSRGRVMSWPRHCLAVNHLLQCLLAWHANVLACVMMLSAKGLYNKLIARATGSQETSCVFSIASRIAELHISCWASHYMGTLDEL